MPTKRFKQLEEAKKQRISDAILHEFERTTYGEMYLARVAREAGVSRGSLYMYFDNKEDMILYALKQVCYKLWDFNKQTLQESQGDFWMMAQESLVFQMDQSERGWSWRMMYIADLADMFLCRSRSKEEADEEIVAYREWIFCHMDRSRFRIRRQEEFDILQETVYSLIFVSLQTYMTGMHCREEVQDSFRRKLDQIKENFLLSA